MGNFNIKLRDENFFELRKDLRNKKGIAPIVFHKDLDETALLFMSVDNNVSVECDISNKNNTLYQNGIKYYNRVDEPDVLEVKTHNFCDKTTWIYGQNNSLFHLCPESHKVIRIKRMQVIAESELSFDNNHLKFAIWFSLTKNCPEFSHGTITNFTATPEDPYWIEIPFDNIQEFTTMIHVDQNGNPEYGVKLFTYKDINDFLIKSRFEKVGDNRYFIRYLYEQEHIDLFLYGDKNERIECFIDGDVEPSSLHLDKIATASFMYDNYNDW